MPPNHSVSRDRAINTLNSNGNRAAHTLADSALQDKEAFGGQPQEIIAAWGPLQNV